MNMKASRATSSDDLRQRKDMFDNTWMLAFVLSASSIVVFWYLGLGQVDVAPIAGTLGTAALLQYLLNWRAEKLTTAPPLRATAMASQAIGILSMGVAWHFFGGLQQPMFPLFIMLPLLTSALILSFWQQQIGILLFLAVLTSGVLLSPDTNSFIEERYGLRILSLHALPAWFPKSRVAFADVSTSPTYNLMLTGSLAILAIALSATGRALLALAWRFSERLQALQGELAQAQHLNSRFVATAPACEVLVALATGRILDVSDRFLQAFDLTSPVVGEFLLDVIHFNYPTVIKRLMKTAGDELQEATIGRREVLLRVRAGVSDAGEGAVVRLTIDICEDTCWRAAVDTLEHPVLAVNARGSVMLVNRSARTEFGAAAVGSDVTSLFETNQGMGRWWDLGPLRSANRVLRREQRQYVAAIRRERVAESIGDLSFVHLHERESDDAVAGF